MGWMIPVEHSKSRVIYDLMKQGAMQTAVVAKQLNISKNSIHVLMHKIRHPRLSAEPAE